MGASRMRESAPFSSSGSEIAVTQAGGAYEFYAFRCKSAAIKDFGSRPRVPNLSTVVMTSKICRSKITGITTLAVVHWVLFEPPKAGTPLGDG